MMCKLFSYDKTTPSNQIEFYALELLYTSKWLNAITWEKIGNFSNTKFLLWYAEYVLTRARTFNKTSIVVNFTQLSKKIPPISNNSALPIHDIQMARPLVSVLTSLIMFNTNVTPNFPIVHGYWNFLLIKIKKFYFFLNLHLLSKQWLNMQHFLTNFLSFNVPFVSFHTNLFRLEALSLNWHFTHFEYALWKLHYRFFFYKLTKFTYQVENFYDDLYDRDLKVIVNSNLTYHRKSLFYWKKSSFFVISLVDATSNPWDISYAIPILHTNHFVQFFFIKFLLSTHKKTARLQYFFNKRIWQNLQL